MIYTLNSIKRYLNNHPFLASMVIFLCVFLSFGAIYINSTGDPLRGDHYFHFKLAYLLRVEGLDVIKNFDWIYLGGEGQYSLSLFQIALIPFTYIDDWVVAISVIDAFFAGIAISIIYYTLKKTKVRYPLFFTVALFTSGYFIARMMWGRAFVLVVALIFLEMRFAIEKKYKTLFGIVLFHILWHQNTYFMPFVVVGIVETARYLVHQKVYIKNIIVTSIAIIAGMAFFPGFPNSIIGWMKRILVIQTNSVASQGSSSSVKSIGGQELLSKDFMSTFVDEKILLFLVIACTTVVIFLYIKQKNGVSKLNKIVNKEYILWAYSLFIFMILTLLGSVAISGRIFDFLIPSIFMLCAFLLTIIIQSKEMHISILLQKFFTAGIVIYVIILSSNTMIDAYIYANKFDYTPTKEVAQWIENNSEGREKVFLLNWSNFTTIFLNNHNNVYSMGMEPMTLKQHDESLYWKYYNIFNYHHYCEEKGDCKGEIKAIQEYIGDDNEKRHALEVQNSQNMITSIKEDFEAKFIVSSLPSFTKAIKLHPELIEDELHVKSDKYIGKSMEFTVFKLK